MLCQQAWGHQSITHLFKTILEVEGELQVTVPKKKWSCRERPGHKGIQEPLLLLRPKDAQAIYASPAAKIKRDLLIVLALFVHHRCTVPKKCPSFGGKKLQLEHQTAKKDVMDYPRTSITNLPGCLPRCSHSNNCWFCHWVLPKAQASSSVPHQARLCQWSPAAGKPQYFIFGSHPHCYL